MVFIAGDQSAEVLEPGVHSLDLPSSLVAPQRAAILGLSALLAIGRDEDDAARFVEHGVVVVAVVSPVADQHAGVVGQCHFVERGFDQRHFVMLGAIDVRGDRKTMAVCDNHDLGPLSPLGFADLVAPFFAPA